MVDEPEVFADARLRELGRHLQAAEARAEAEILELEADRDALRRRNLSDVAIELRNRGDKVAVHTAGRIFTGVITYVAGDLATMDTPGGQLDLNLESSLALQVIERVKAGGVGGSTNDVSGFRPRLQMHLLAGTRLEIGSPTLPGPLVGRLTAVAVDHVLLAVADRQTKSREDQRQDWFLPLATTAYALARR